MNTWFVVGNKFSEFAANNGVVTIGELEGLLRSKDNGHLPVDLKLVPGQGLREADMYRLRHEARQASAGAEGNGIGIELGPVRASRLLTHKYQLQNSIVSVPQRLGEDLFESALLLDERSELMGDHQTGQHIQGMVLVEAARQMFLAVTEEYFIGYDDPTRYYFVINSMDVAFTAFVFPVEATLHYEILQKKIDNRARMFFRVAISVNQAGRSVTRIGYEFTAFHAQRIEAKEREQAVAVLSSVRETRQQTRITNLDAEVAA